MADHRVQAEARAQAARHVGSARRTETTSRDCKNLGNFDGVAENWRRGIRTLNRFKLPREVPRPIAADHIELSAAQIERLEQPHARVRHARFLMDASEASGASSEVSPKPA